MGAIFLMITKTGEFNVNCTRAFMEMKSRGPDDSCFISETTPRMAKNQEADLRRIMSRSDIANYTQLTVTYGYHRLSINDLSLDASQPFEDPIPYNLSIYSEIRQRPQRKLLCNGEIYNSKAMIDEYTFTDRDLQSQSDVEVILPLYIKEGINTTLNKLEGEFALILMENINTFQQSTMNVYVARDKLGIKPLYMVKHKSKLVYLFSSELKGIPDHILKDTNYIVQEVPPGTYWSFNNSVIKNSKDEFIRYYDWNKFSDINMCKYLDMEPDTLAIVYENIKALVLKSIEERITTTDRSMGVLLSGGFDSCLILSHVVKLLHEYNSNNEKVSLAVYTFGNVGASDVASAKECVQYLVSKYGINIEHHVIGINEQFLSQNKTSLQDLVYILETDDKEILQQGLLFNYLLKYVKEKTPEVKVLLSGEGLDELCGYHYDGTTDIEYQLKSVDTIQKLCKNSIMRADKIAGAHGIEVRHPFLDCAFIEFVLYIHPKLKRPIKYNINQPEIEKYIIRKAFDQTETVLPYNLLWKPADIISSTIFDYDNIFEQLCNEVDLHRILLERFGRN